MIVELLGWFLLVPIGSITIVLLVEFGLGLVPYRAAPSSAGRPRIAIIVPARDEVEGIATMVAPLLAMKPDMRVLVVADNCSDDTAGVARDAGAEVIERDEPARLGKGFALAFARDHLATDPPEVVIVIDADCQADAASIVRLAARAAQSGRPVQAAYLMRPRRDRGVLVALSGFAFLVKNLVRQQGLARLGAPAILTGSGMAFPWTIFARAPLASDDTVEDLSLGIALSRADSAPLFLPEAHVWTEAAGRAATHAQRGRWERGFLATAVAHAPALIASRRAPLIWLGLHLLIPPLALLVVLHVALLILMLALPAPPVMSGIELVLALALLVTFGIAWMRRGRCWLSWPMLAAIPFYIVWKLPIYAAALLGGKRHWNPTRR